MIFLIFFAFLAGIVTILSPCILPILPLILTGAVGASRRRPLGIVAGFIASFTFFTLFLSAIVRATGLSADALRTTAVIIVAIFGVSLLFPKFQVVLEQVFSRFAQLLPTSTQSSSGFAGGFLVGLSLGLVWAPCVGPILASVITLAATSQVNAAAIVITLSYSLGTAIPMFAIMVGGRALLARAPFLTRNGARIQQAFGAIMIFTALAIGFGWDRNFQTLILTTFPQYGTGLTKFEDNAAVDQALDKTLSPENQNRKPTEKSSMNLPFLSEPAVTAPEISGGNHWLNSEPLTLAGLRGKVVLIDFWTYTCINCIRTLPYVTGWYEKYKDQGLVVIGVHSPEFEFEKETANVEKAIRDYKITYPVVQDNDFTIWRAYSNRYWPAHYFIDVNGKIRHTHFGEGKYDESEKVIQELLAEIPNNRVEGGVLAVQETEITARTPETYLGFSRMANFASPEEIRPSAEKTYSIPSSLRPNEFAFAGSWMVGDEYSRANKNANLRLRFFAKRVFLVMRKADPAKPARAQVYLDGEKSQANTADAVNGELAVSDDRLYTILELPNAGDHTLDLIFPDGNVEVYAFTFG